ncbi:HugZ family pyridoxamine 5'-phosphate oxidase [Roseivivax sp. CAU 1753]
MCADKIDPIRPTDDTARALARDLIAAARFGALGTIEVETGAPMVTRIALVPGPDALPLSLVSDLSAHSRALRANPVCSVLLGEPGPRGDPLTHPRLTLQARAAFIPHDHPDHPDLAAHYLRHAPKAKLYIGFADFSLLRFAVHAAYLNGGFGKAFRLTARDLTA